MSSNFFLDGNYTAKQIESINKVKGKKAEAQTAAKGDSSSIFDDITAYNKNKEAKTNNSDLFSYIEKAMGMDNFLNLLDADGNGQVSKDEAAKISNYDNSADLTSGDIDALTKDLKNVKNAKSTTTANGKTTETTWELDSKTNQLVKKSATTTNTKTNGKYEYTYNDDGTVKSKVNKLKNTTTEYEYKDGKKVSSKVYANDDKKTLKAEYTYNENGKVKDKKQYISSSSGVRGKSFFTYTYDANGKRIGATKYKGDSATGTPTAEYEYKYGENGKLDSIYNKTSGRTRKFSRDENGKVTQAVVTNKDGKEIATYKYNDDGTYKSKTTDKYTTLYEYGTGGIRTKATKYNKADVTDDKVKDGAKAVSTSTYEDGLRKQTVAGDKTTSYTYDKDYNLTSRSVKDKSGTETETYTYENGKIKTLENKAKNTKTEYTYDKDGNKTKEVTTNTKTKETETTEFDTKGNITAKTKVASDFVYVYTYKDGKQTGVKKYKASDCVDGKPKDGATPVS